MTRTELLALTICGGKISLIAIACGFLCIQSAEADTLSVPADESLPADEYIRRGVPDPAESWTANDYEQALRALSSMPRRQLPRAGSDRSQLLFDRLLISFAQAFELEYEGPIDEEVTLPPPSLQELYSVGNRDDLLFDRESVAIRSEALARSLKTLPDRAELLDLADRSIELMRNASSEAARKRASEGVRQSEESAKHVADLLKQQVVEMLAIAGVPEARDSARQEMLRRAQDLLPQLPRFLSTNDLRWIANVVRGAAGPDINMSIRSGLLQLADQIEGNHRNADRSKVER
jgi:hypothetical protein